jgi:hypothetical protein
MIWFDRRLKTGGYFISHFTVPLLVSVFFIDTPNYAQRI